jgi:hypothetical protein
LRRCVSEHDRQRLRAEQKPEPLEGLRAHVRDLNLG